MPDENNQDQPSDSGVLGDATSNLPVIDKDGRATIAAWRARMRDGRASVVEWLDENGKGTEGYASTLLECRESQDDRVRIAALKLEAQLREWFGDEKAATVNVDQSVNVSEVHVGMPSWVRERMRDPKMRAAWMLLCDDAIEAEVEVHPKLNGKVKRGES